MLGYVGREALIAVMTPEDRERLTHLAKQLSDEEDLGKFHGLVREVNELLDNNLRFLRETNQPYKPG